MWTAPYGLYSGGLTTTPVNGSTVDLLETCDKHIVQTTISVTGGGDTLNVLEGSLDGVNWYALTATYEPGNSVSSTVFNSTVAARYVRIVTWVNSGTATVSITGASGTE